MNKIENYLGIANHDIQIANNNQELKNYVASILCEIDELQQENQQLKINWNKLKVYIKTEIPEDVFIDTEWFVSILDKMKELEQGSDSNE